MMHSYGLHYGYMGFGWLFQIAIIILFFLVIWWMLKNGGRFGFRCRDNDTAIDILNKRLAKGEIDLKEFNKLKKEIQNGDRQ